MRWAVRSVVPSFHVSVAFLAACTPATTRPAFAPHPEALRAIVNAPPNGVVTEAQAWLAAQTPAPAVRLAHPGDGYLETQWVEVPDSTGPTLRTKLRVWADPDVPRKARVTIEAVYRPLEDPSRTARDLERPVPPGSAAARLAERLLEGLKEKLGETKY